MSTLIFHLNSALKLHTFVPGYGWEPVLAWATLPDGSRQRTDQQERNDKGEALWSRYAYLNRISYGKATPEMVELRMWSAQKPTEEFSDDWGEK